jgi:hypothetical protein
LAVVVAVVYSEEFLLGCTLCRSKSISVGLIAVSVGLDWFCVGRFLDGAIHVFHVSMSEELQVIPERLIDSLRLMSLLAELYSRIFSFIDGAELLGYYASRCIATAGRESESVGCITVACTMVGRKKEGWSNHGGMYDDWGEAERGVITAAYTMTGAKQRGE